jgi:hypothetical protein
MPKTLFLHVFESHCKDKVVQSGSGVKTAVKTGAVLVPSLLFTNWREVLHESSLQRQVQLAYEGGIEAYLDYCRLNGQSVTVQTARDFMPMRVGGG